jgi:hypothetical protein
MKTFIFRVPLSTTKSKQVMPGWLIRGIEAANPSKSWLLINDDYVPPMTLQWRKTVQGIVLTSALITTGPDGQAPILTGAEPTIILYDEPIGYSAGIRYYSNP